MKCKVCDKESPATLCSICFLEEVVAAVEAGEEDPSRILKGMVNKYGRLRHLKSLPSYRAIFTPQKIRREITHAETGEKCKLIPTYDGWIAVAERMLSEPGEPFKGEQIAEGGRIIRYYEGEKVVKEIHLPTSLVFRRPGHHKRTRFISSGPPSPHYRSPIAHERPASPLDK